MEAVCGLLVVSASLVPNRARFAQVDIDVLLLDAGRKVLSDRCLGCTFPTELQLIQVYVTEQKEPPPPPTRTSALGVSSPVKEAGFVNTSLGASPKFAARWEQIGSGGVRSALALWGRRSSPEVRGSKGLGSLACRVHGFRGSGV